MDELVDDKGKKKGDIADLGNGWWFTHTAAASVSNKFGDDKTFCAAGSAELGISYEAKAVGESSALAIKIFGLSLEVTTAAVGSVKLGPGPNISYDGAKGKLVTNSVYINQLTHLELTTVQHRAALSKAQALVQDIELVKAHVDGGGAKMSVAQVINA